MIQISGYTNYFITQDGKVWSKKNNKFLKAGVDHTGYLIVSLFENGIKSTRSIHQLVAIHYMSHVPDGYKTVVDHIDNNKLNNHVSNLQLITQRKNTSKDKNKNTSMYTGVCWNKKSQKWQSYIRINNKKVHLGLFTNELDANNAYQKKLNQIKQ